MPFLAQKNIYIISYFLVDDIKMFYSGILNNLPVYSLFLSPLKYIFLKRTIVIIGLFSIFPSSIKYTEVAY